MGPTPVVDYFQGTSSFWKKIYETPSLNGLIYRERMALALRWVEGLGLPRGSRALDVGCGAGLASVSLAHAGYHVDALDAAPQMTHLTRELAAENGLDDRINTQAGDVQELPYDGESFALVIALGLLPWCPNADRVVQEIARVLQPGGYALITADNRWCLNRMLDPGLNRVFSLPRRAARKIRRTFQSDRQKSASVPAPPAFRHSIGAVDRWAQGSGLHKVKGGTVGFGPFTWFERPFLSEETGIRLHHQLQQMADRRMIGLRSIGWHYLVLAQKPRG